MTDQSGEEMLEQAASQIAQAMEEESSDDAVLEEETVEEEVVDEESDVEEEVVDEEDDEPADEYADLTDEERSEMDRARKAGWRPKSEFKGDPKDWKDFDEFNRVGDRIVSNLNSKIDMLTQQNEQQRAAINKMMKAQGAIIKQTQDKVIEDLKKQRKEAIQYGDEEAVDALDAEINSATQKAKEAELDEEEESPQPQIDQAVKDFMDQEKSWFNQSNPDMVNYAISVENAERQSFPNDDSEQIMERVKAAVAQRFPGRIQTTQKPRKSRQVKQSPVEGGTPTVRSKAVKLSDFPKEVQDMANYFEKHCGISKKDYLKQLQEGMS